MHDEIRRVAARSRLSSVCHLSELRMRNDRSQRAGVSGVRAIGLGVVAAVLAASSLVGCKSPQADARRHAPPRPILASNPEPVSDTHASAVDAPTAAEETKAQPASRPAASSAAPTTSKPADAQDASPLRLLDNFHAIEEGRAYRSAQLYADTLEWVVKHHGVRTVINLRGPNPQTDWYPAEKERCEKLGVKLIDIPLSAFRLPPPDRLLELYDAIKNSPEPLLFHCRAGADRTGMAAAIWRMMQRSDSETDAAAELSIKYGHFRVRHPKMLELVEMFEPRREWVTDEYPKLYSERAAAEHSEGGAEE